MISIPHCTDIQFSLSPSNTPLTLSLDSTEAPSPKLNANRAVSHLAFQIDNVTPETSSLVLQDCYKVITDFKNSTEFIRLFQSRVVKVIDKLIVPSLLKFTDLERFNVLEKTMKSISDDPVLFPHPKVHREDAKQLLIISCQLIKNLAKLQSDNLIVDMNVWIILLDYLVDCYLVAFEDAHIESDQFTTITNLENLILNTMMTVITASDLSISILHWFLAKTQTTGDITNRIILSLFSKFLDNVNERIVQDPDNLSLVNKCIVNLAENSSEQLLLENILWNRLETDCQQLKSESRPVKTVVISPKKSVSVADLLGYKNYLSIQRGKPPTPSWLELFEELGESTLTGPHNTIATTNDNLLEQPRHPHFETFKNFWNKIFNKFADKDHWEDITDQEQHIGFWHRWIKGMKQENKSLSNRRVHKKRSRPRKKLTTRKNEKHHRYHLKSKPVHYKYHGGLQKSPMHGQKLYHYYRLNGRFSEAKLLRRSQLESTYLGHVRGDFHRFQICYQSKLARVGVLLRGFEKDWESI